MTKIVRTELKYQRDSDKYPTEIAWTEEGTWIIPDLHLGRWTGRVAAPGEPIEEQQRTGGRITRDELHADSIAAAKTLGWAPPPRAGLLIFNVEATHGKLNPLEALELTTYAHQALEWMNQNKAPEGRRFVLEDALYLIRDSDSGRDVSQSA